MSEPLRIPAWYYSQFDADYTRDVPAEGYGGWKKETLEFSRDNTAVVSMHAWDCGTREEFPGWWRSVEMIPRSYNICETVFPEVLGAVRASTLPLFHVVGGGNYYEQQPGYRHALELAGPEPPAFAKAEPDEYLNRLYEFRQRNVFVGEKNVDDVNRGIKQMDFAPLARPHDDEGVAATGHQLFALCKERGINHLIYVGFAINWCLLLSPGGMHDMSQRGIMCSTIREATTAVENAETARKELCKQIALWRVALAFGFVFDAPDFVQALRTQAARPD